MMHLDWWTIGLQTLNFAILVWLLHRFLYKPVLTVIEARKQEVQRQFDAAKAVEQKAAAELAAVEAARAGISAERDAALKAAAAQARDAAGTRRAQSERDAEALLDAARKTLASERERALEDAGRLALDLGTEFAQRLLVEIPLPLRAEAWIERIEQYLSALPPADRAELAHQLADGTALTIVSACPLPAATDEQWKERLCHALGASFSVKFEVEPALIAGVELHFPTAILRFSWQDAIAAARTELARHG